MRIHARARLVLEDAFEVAAYLFGSNPGLQPPHNLHPPVRRVGEPRAVGIHVIVELDRQQNVLQLCRHALCA